ncbi:hypothetical protein [Aquiflexum gelatinilyticum]|uniref:Uncharacterized protein n=1 Tax=Aquiflexum gelatinilyticum TaxID=2961943 RepID=A0A9X2SZK8_9BACT|nr:hypothetical protein [Aquiflexum gelatinilyticum]MCR9014613.1 hypothetical protein [Aquiflexum gelatinilyticum]
MEVFNKTVKRNWVCSNMIALVRFLMLNYIHLINVLNNPEKVLKEEL